MKVQTIFGEWIEGEERAKGEYDNIYIFEDERGWRHVVHKSDVDKNHKRNRTKVNDWQGYFDLELCKRIGKSGRKTKKKGY